MSSGKLLELTTSNFSSDVLNSDQPVLVDFWADWCNPCKMIAPFVEQIAEEYAGTLRVGKIDADEAQDITTQYGVMSLPTLMLFKGGQPIARITGFQTKDKIVNQLMPHL